MGFGEIWHLYDTDIFPTSDRLSFQRNLTFSPPPSIIRTNVKDGIDNNTPWLIVDMSNVAGMICTITGGHRALFETNVYLYWKAILSSGFQVKVVKDGQHDALRAVKKLTRMLSTANKLDIDSSTGAMGRYLHAQNIFYHTLSECQAEWQQMIVQGSLERMPTVDIVTAVEEADDFIRDFCNERILNAPQQSLIILSNDASLILGLSGRVHIVSPSRLELRQRDTFESTDLPVLFGAVIPVAKICDTIAQVSIYALESLGNPLNNPLLQFMRTNRISSSVLLMVSCILGGEYRSVDFDDLGSKPFGADDPYGVIIFISNFIFEFDSSLRQRENRKLCGLVCATITVMTFYAGMIGNAGYPDITSTSSISKSECFDHFYLFLKEMRNCANSLINENNRNRVNFAPPNIFRLLFRCNQQSFFKICVATSSIHVERMTKVLKSRLATTVKTETPSIPKVLYSSDWGTWLPAMGAADTEESIFALHSFDIDAALYPLRSLTSQIQMALQYSSRPTALLLPPPPDSNSSSAAWINAWLAEQELLEKSAAASTTFITRLHWKASVATQCPIGCQTFTEKSLHTFTTLNHKLPETGFYFSSSSMPRGLQWSIATTLSSSKCPPTSNFAGSHALFDFDERLSLLIFLSSAAAERETKSSTPDIVADLLSKVGFSNLSEIAASIEVFWTSSCKEWFTPASSSFSSLQMSALMCATLLQSLMAVFRNDMSILTEAVLESIVQACLLSPLFSRSVASAVKIVSAGNIVETKPGIEHMTTQIAQWQDSVNHALQLTSPYSYDTYCWTDIIGKIMAILNDLTYHDQCSEMLINRWVDFFAISAVIQCCQSYSSCESFLCKEGVSALLGWNTASINSTEYLFVNGMSIPAGTTTSTSEDRVQIIVQNLKKCSSDLVAALSAMRL
mmetsp:Transcript_14382/g.19699  ORF Transcript_14382/g.19699 Transcript_14382/m.19699 type:complete len:910 (-) Transcript_14382:129-2858(-)